MEFLKGLVDTDPAELSPMDQQGNTLYSLAKAHGATEVTDLMRRLLTDQVEQYNQMLESEELTPMGRTTAESFRDKLVKALSTTQE